MAGNKPKIAVWKLQNTMGDDALKLVVVGVLTKQHGSFISELMKRGLEIKKLRKRLAMQFLRCCQKAGPNE